MHYTNLILSFTSTPLSDNKPLLVSLRLSDGSQLIVFTSLCTCNAEYWLFIQLQVLAWRNSILDYLIYYALKCCLIVWSSSLFVMYVWCCLPHFKTIHSSLPVIQLLCLVIEQIIFENHIQCNAERWAVLLWHQHFANLTDKS